MKDFVYLNGKFVKEKYAKISVFDAGLFYGWGAFETMRSYDGKIFRLDAHLDRLFGSLKFLMIKINFTKLQLKTAVSELIKKNQIKNGYIRITVTAGKTEGQLNLNNRQKSNLFIIARKLKPSAKKAITAQIAGLKRNDGSLLSGLKSANYLENILAKMDAKKRGFDEAILLNTKGFVAEAATANLFLVKNGNLLTPSLDSGILPGITRQVIIEIAKKEGIGVKENKIKLNELLSAQEIFLTNSIIEILPVARIGAKKIGAGKIGPLTERLSRLYRNKILREIW